MMFVNQIFVVLSYFYRNYTSYFLYSTKFPLLFTKEGPSSYSDNGILAFLPYNHNYMISIGSLAVIILFRFHSPPVPERNSKFHFYIVLAFNNLILEESRYLSICPALVESMILRSFWKLFIITHEKVSKMDAIFLGWAEQSFFYDFFADNKRNPIIAQQ